MAKKKSKKYPYQWPDGSWHSIPWSEAKQNPYRKGGGPTKGRPTMTDPETGQQMVFNPGSPGVPRPPIEPFLTGEQMALDASKKAEWEREIIDIDAELERLEAQVEYDKAEIDKNAARAKYNVRDNTAAAGWTGSSVQDADLIDIDSTATIRKKFMTTALDNARLAAKNRKQVIQDERDAWVKALNQMMIENAQGMSTDLGPWLQEPTEGKWVPVGHGQSTDFPGFSPPKRKANEPYSPMEQFAAHQFTQRKNAKTSVSHAQKNTGPPKGVGGNPF